MFHFLKKRDKRIYLDHAATTPIDASVLRVMQPLLREQFGNPGSIHSEGLAAKKALESSRKQIAQVIHAASDEVIFTGSGTEANNLALFGAVETWKSLYKTSPHIITTTIEHHSVLVPVKKLEQWGVRVTYVYPNREGVINPEDIKRALTPDTVLVSVMYANNEIGTMQLIAEIAKLIRSWRKDHLQTAPYPLFHSDMCQAPGQLSLDVPKLGVDMASFTGQKMYAPKGTGFLYKKREIVVAPQIVGGTQERRLRAGTENIAGVVGMAYGLVHAEEIRDAEVNRLTQLRDYFIGQLLLIDGTVLNGSQEERLANNINVSFPNLVGEQMVIELDRRGVGVATGSACTTEAVEPSHVIMSLGDKDEELLRRARGAVRFSMGRTTTKKDLDYVLECVKKIIEKQKRF